MISRYHGWHCRRTEPLFAPAGVHLSRRGCGCMSSLYEAAQHQRSALMGSRFFELAPHNCPGASKAGSAQLDFQVLTTPTRINHIWFRGGELTASWVDVDLARWRKVDATQLCASPSCRAITAEQSFRFLNWTLFDLIIWMGGRSWCDI